MSSLGSISIADSTYNYITFRPQPTHSTIPEWLLGELGYIRDQLLFEPRDRATWFVLQDTLTALLYDLKLHGFIAKPEHHTFDSFTITRTGYLNGRVTFRTKNSDATHVHACSVVGALTPAWARQQLRRKLTLIKYQQPFSVHSTSIILPMFED